MDALKETVDKLLGVDLNKKTVTAHEPTSEEYDELNKAYTTEQQGQIFTFWGELTPAEKASLFEQAKGFDPAHISKLADTAINPPKVASASESTIEPVPESVCSSILDSKPEDNKAWYEGGLEHVANNRVGVVLMAGGQGTRLGSSAPKGCYDIGLPSHKSLFQLQAERILKVQELAAKAHGVSDPVIPWYVMTSGPTRGPTEKFFQEHGYFGLKKQNVFIFEQGVLPCITLDGKIILESKSKIAVAPDGNGGLYSALVSSGAVQDMKKRGVEHLHAYCVDNCLVRVADPTFIGFAASRNVDIATKVVRKRDAHEAAGIIISKDGHPDVIEYSEIDKETAEAKDPKNPELLKYRHANIVNHYYSTRFLDNIPEWVHRLPHHVANKKIPYVDLKSGETVKPEKPNGIKLEQFVFDCFAFLTFDKFATQEVRREDEFSPLKNARGMDYECFLLVTSLTW